MHRPPAVGRRREPCSCSTCTCLMVCAVVILFCLVAYVPIMISMKPVPVFTWGPAVDRNMSRYIRPEQNTTLLQPPTHTADSCRPFLLIMVQSSVKNFEARNAIRETWGSIDSMPAGTRLQFLVGTTANGSLSENLTAENEVHGDIIQQDFVDTYSNLTLKTVMTLKWATSSCHPSFILKVDEDMFINVPNLVSYLREDEKVSPDMILGGVICNAAPINDKFSKYYSPRHMFTHRYFPMYVSGTAYVLGAKVAARLYRQALKMPLYHLEDVFITGMCASRIGVRPTDHAGFSYAQRKLDPCLFAHIVSAHKVTPEELRDVWRQLQSASVRLRCAAQPTPKPRKLVLKCRH